MHLLLKGLAMIPIFAQATLPTGLAQADHSIAAMHVGEEGWTVPWAMYHDKERKLWLNGSYLLHARPGGTVQMLVRHDESGWHVDATKAAADYQWGEGAYIGNFSPIRVATFNR